MYSAYILCFILMFLIFCLFRGLKSKRVYSDDTTQKTTISIIISARNEAHNIEHLLSSIQKIKYSKNKYEIILIDDNSTDNTFQKIMSFKESVSNDIRNTFAVKCHVIKLVKDNPSKFDTSQKEYTVYAKEGKKNAIQIGIDSSQYEWIALSDADCILHTDWLLSIDSHIQDKPKSSMFIGYCPEMYHSPFQYFKQVALAINYASTTLAGFPVSCTGRNLVFNKQTFYDVGGYNGLFNYPAGDDKLLLKRFQKNKKKIGYIAFPFLHTRPVHQSELKQQNVRRFGKFFMSLLSWQLGKVFIGALLLFLPIELILRFPESITPMIAFIITINLYMTVGFILHKERIKCVYYFYSIIFPYYMMVQMLYSLFVKWTWKGNRS